MPLGQSYRPRTEQIQIDRCNLKEKFYWLSWMYGHTDGDNEKDPGFTDDMKKSEEYKDIVEVMIAEEMDLAEQTYERSYEEVKDDIKTVKAAMSKRLEEKAKEFYTHVLRTHKNGHEKDGADHIKRYDMGLRGYAELLKESGKHEELLQSIRTRHNRVNSTFGWIRRRLKPTFENENKIFDDEVVTFALYHAAKEYNAHPDIDIEEMLGELDQLPSDGVGINALFKVTDKAVKVGKRVNGYAHYYTQLNDTGERDGIDRIIRTGLDRITDPLVDIAETGLNAAMKYTSPPESTKAWDVTGRTAIRPSFLPPGVILFGVLYYVWLNKNKKGELNKLWGRISKLVPVPTVQLTR